VVIRAIRNGSTSLRLELRLTVLDLLGDGPLQRLQPLGGHALDDASGPLRSNSEPGCEHGPKCYKEGSVSYIVLAVVSVSLIRLAIACVYSRRIYWDE
jgi:hypothetical protein